MLDQLDMFADVGAADYRDSLTDADRATLEAARLILQRSLPKRDLITSWDALQDYLAVTLGGLRAESARVIFLDRKNRLIADEEIGRGTIDHVPVYPREIARRALQLDASAVILAHCHPSGDTAPSDADVSMTGLVKAVLAALGVVLHDSVIAGGDKVLSLRALGHL